MWYGKRAQSILSKSSLRLSSNSPSPSLCAASVVATVAASLPSAGGVIVSSDAASRNCDSNGAFRGAWLAAAIRVLRGDRRCDRDDGC
jgi:hypothetical protein